MSIDYNKIPVHYCKTCLSLKIKILDKTELNYCACCGNTEISKASNESWEEIFKNKYGKYYINT